MRNKILFLFISTLISVSTFAQNVEKGFKSLKDGDYTKAESYFQKAVEKKEDVSAAKLGLAYVYENPAYTKNSLDKAYRFAVYVEKKTDKETTVKELEKYGYSKADVTTLKKSISEKSLAKLSPDATIFELNTFISKYEGSDIADQVKKRRNAAAFALAEKENTFSSYQNFFETYSDAEQASEAKTRFEKLWRAKYDEAAADGEQSSLTEFKKQYPDYPFYDDKSRRDDSLAFVASRLNFSKSAVSSDEKDFSDYIKAAAPRELAYVALQRLIEPKLKNKQFANAVAVLRQYQPLFPNDDRIAKMIETLNAPDKNIIVAGIGKKVNTIGWEYAPSLTADMKKLYFCGQNRDSNLVKDNEDIFVSELKNNEWQTPVPVHSLNTPTEHEAPLSVSADGNTMLLYSKSDIYFSQKQADGWSPMQRFPAINEPRSWDADAMITADGEAVLFISDRKGNIGKFHPFSEDFHGSSNGNSDIYVSVKTRKGWSEPKNLGPTINTPFSERSPFLHPDMKTLYFSSEGHGSLGRLDVYKCTRLSDTSWTQWSEPVNMGKEINGPLDEQDYKISTDGKFAIFTGYKDYNFDIFTAMLPPELQPQTVSTVTGHIVDQNGKFLDAGVKWENLENGDPIGNLRSDPADGSYIIVLPNGKNYGFYAEKEAYYPVAGNIDLRNVTVNQTIQRDIVLVSVDDIINKNTSVTMSNLFFDYDKYDLKPESYPELNRFADFLKSHPDLKAEISGHTDNKGSAEHNQKLSQNRADAVKDYLINHGCSAGNLSSVGFGSQKPVASNETEDTRAKNRRVEFRIVK